MISQYMNIHARKYNFIFHSQILKYKTVKIAEPTFLRLRTVVRGVIFIKFIN
jgi:hypothetical protein